MDKKISSPFQLNKLPKNTFEILVEIPFEEISKTEKKVLEDQAKNIEIKGFRKGMAPANLVKEALGKEKIIRLILEVILPDFFKKAVDQLNLKPIVSPKVELLSAADNEAWKVKYVSCEEPEVVLGNYKTSIKKETKSEDKIWTPGDKEETKPKEDQNAKEKSINKALEWLIKNIKVEISDLLLEDEVARKLSGLLEQTQKLGLTLDQYLSSLGKTIEKIKEEYKKQAEESLAFEFILGKIAEEEKISVSEEDLTKALSEAKTEEEKKALESQKYYIALLLRRQKTLDFLANL